MLFFAFSSADGRAKQSPGNNSFDRFNIAMVQQYLKEEAVRHQHKVWQLNSAIHWTSGL